MATVQINPYLPVKAQEVEYPEGDGKPMAETEFHLVLMINLYLALKYFFRQRPEVYVGSNMLVYYVEGDPTKSFAPDVFVVLGIPKGQRRTYKLWIEGKAPDLVIELTSRGTRREDLYVKMALYEQLGVKEYYLFDPLAEYLKPPFQAYRLTNDGYVRVEGTPVVSEVLGLELRAEGDQLRCYDPETGQPLPIPDEMEEARRLAEDRATEAYAARRIAEDRATEAYAARHLAETRAAEAEAELARLRAELERLRRAR